jgi:hypothetical protein
MVTQTLRAVRFDYDSVKSASGLSILAGAWLVATPWIFDIRDNLPAMWNAVFVGLLVTASGATRFFGADKTASMGWLSSLLGVWLFVSPWRFGYGAAAAVLWDSMIMGTVVMALGVLSALPHTTTHDPTKTTGIPG